MNVHRVKRILCLVLVLALCAGIGMPAALAAEPLEPALDPPEPEISREVPPEADPAHSSTAQADTLEAWSNDAEPTETIKALLNAQTLHPQKSGWDVLDNRIEFLLSTCTPGTYNQLWEMYDWLVKAAVHSWDGYSYTSASLTAYNSFSLDYLKDMTYEQGLQKAYPDDVSNHAYHMLQYKKGTAYDYACAFVAVARYMGIEAYFRTGGFQLEDTNTAQHHGWAVLMLDGKEYIFDLQRDAVNWSTYRRTGYYFGIPESRNWRYLPNANSDDRAANEARAAAMLPVTSQRGHSVTITTVADGNGVVTGSGTYTTGSTVTVTAEAGAGSRFTGWYANTGTLLSANAAYSFTAAQDITVIAKFSLEYNVRVLGEGGTVTGAGKYVAGEKAVLTVVPDYGKALEGWYDRLGRLMSRDSTYSFTVRGNTTITLKMMDLAVVTTVASRSGSSAGDGAYYPGSQVSVSAIAGDKPFVGWYDEFGNQLTTSADYTFKASSSRTLYALFEGDVFADIPAGVWYANSAMEAVSRGLLSGTTAVTFSPTAYFTRAMAAAMIARLDKADTAAAPASPFTDVPNGTWFTKSVNWAYENGIISGRSSTEFAPNDQVTRQEFAAMVIRYLNKKGYAGSTEEPLPFTDVGDISGWALDYMHQAYAMGLISGYPEGNVLPMGFLTRAEGTSIMVRVAKYMESHEPDLTGPTADDPETPADTPADETPSDETPSETPGDDIPAAG